jgi:hypothetical protein
VALVRTDVSDLRCSRRWLWRMVSSGLLRREALVRTDVSDLRCSRRWLWRMVSSGMLRHVALIRTDVSDLRCSRQWLWRIVSYGMLRRVALVRSDVSEELSASIIMVTKTGELGTTLAVASNQRTLRRNTKWERKLVWNSDLGCREEWR